MRTNKLESQLKFQLVTDLFVYSSLSICELFPDYIQKVLHSCIFTYRHFFAVVYVSLCDEYSFIHRSQRVELFTILIGSR